MTLLIAALALSRLGTVSLEQPAVRLKTVLPELSKQTGYSLSATDDLGSAFVVLKFVQTPADRAIQDIASGLNATWSERNGVKVLTRNPLKDTSNQQSSSKSVHDYFEKAKAITRWTIADADKFVKKNLDYAEKHPGNAGVTDWREYSELQNDSLERRLLARIVLSIGENAFLAMKPDTRVVYSTRPTVMQRPLGSGLAQWLSEYSREARLHKDALAKAGITENSQQENSMYMPGLMPYHQDIDNVGTILLVVKNENFNLQVSLEILSPTGETSSNMQDYIGAMREPTKPAEPKDMKFEGNFEPSEKSLSIAKAMASTMGGGSSEATEKDKQLLLETFKDLNKNELLGMLPSELMLQTAKSRSKDLVVELPDASVFLMMSPEIKKVPKLNDVWKMIRSFGLFEIDETDSSLIVRSGDYPMLSNFNLPRTAMSIFVNRMAKEGKSIDGLADFSLAVPNNELFPFVLQVAMAPFDSIGSFNMNDQGMAALKLYAALDPASKQKAKNGGYSVNIGSLPPNLSKSVNWFVYTDQGKIIEGEIDTSQPNSYHESGNLESTTLFATGLPSQGRVTFRLKKDNGLIMQSTYGGGYRSTNLTNAEDIANQVAWRTASPESSQTTMKFGKTGYEQLDVVVELGGKKHVKSQYRLLDKIDPSGLTGIEGLPEDIRKLVAEKTAEYRKNFQNGSFSGPRQGTIKP